MKTYLILLSTIILLATGCKKDPLLVGIDGLSLYWDNRYLGENGRSLIFEFYSSARYDNDYDLHFEYTISGNSIHIELVSAIGDGKCLAGIGKIGCKAKGGFSIAEE